MRMVKVITVTCAMVRVSMSTLLLHSRLAEPNEIGMVIAPDSGSLSLGSSFSCGVPALLRRPIQNVHVW